MPRTARFKIAAIQELLRQLEYAPAETRRRQMDAAEALIADLDPHQNYPEDFIIFRITGYRPDRAEEQAGFGVPLHRVCRRREAAGLFQ